MAFNWACQIKLILYNTTGYIIPLSIINLDLLHQRTNIDITQKLPKSSFTVSSETILISFIAKEVVVWQKHFHNSISYFQFKNIYFLLFVSRIKYLFFTIKQKSLPETPHFQDYLYVNGEKSLTNHISLFRFPKVTQIH